MKRQSSQKKICMLAVFPALVATFVAPETDARSTGEFTNKWAIVVGVSKTKDHSIEECNFGSKNATAFANYLIDDAHYPKDHVVILTNEAATQKAVKQVLGPMKPYHGECDLITVYFSAPVLNDRGGNYFAVYDSKKAMPYATAIAMNTISRTVRERYEPAGLVVIIDTSHAGIGRQGPVPGNFSRKFPVGTNATGGVAMIRASVGDQESLADKKSGISIFTHFLIADLQKAGSGADLFAALQNLPEQVAGSAKSNWQKEQTVTIENDGWAGQGPCLAQ
jgi:hypothetical protein